MERSISRLKNTYILNLKCRTICDLLNNALALNEIFVTFATDSKLNKLEYDYNIQDINI